MKNTYIAILVLILIIGGLFFFMKSKKTEAPSVNSEESSAINDQKSTDTTTEINSEISTPVGTVSGNVKIGAVKEFTVSGKNFSFSPSLITVKKGDKVKITFNNTEGFHDFKIDEFGVATKQIKSPDVEVLEFTADKVGSFEYYCSVGSHRSMGMKGTLKVE